MNETHPILEELEHKADYFKANLDSLAAVDTTEFTSIWKYLQASEALMVDVFDAENAGKIPDVGGRQGELGMYHQWSNNDPPTQAEFVRNDRIRGKQGNGNPFVEIFPRQ